MTALFTYGRTVWRTFGGRGLRRRAVHEVRRAAGAFRRTPAAADPPAPTRGRSASQSAYRPAASFAGLPDAVRARILDRGARVLAGEYQGFGAHWRPLPAGADGWASTPGGVRFPDGPWWSVPHLPAGADIKDVWEPARFGWVYDLARAHWLSPDPAFAAAFYARVGEWAAACPPFAGVHWSCGQEVAIRALAILHGEAVLDAPSAAAAAAVARVLAWSGERVADAVGYGLSQRNNHGISESAGLVHLGLRLAGVHPSAARWLSLGRRLLDEQIADQFSADGWYAQHSFVYMRVALSQALAAERALRRAGHSLAPASLARLGAGARLLAAVADADTGAVPNVGANDGSQVLPLASAEYGDFRPVLTLAAVVLGLSLPAELRPDPEVLAWVGVDPPPAAPARTDGVLVGPDAGWVVARRAGVRLFLRAGEFRHRPSHMDLMHVCVACDGREVVVDAGTFAYNAPPPWRNGLASAAVHNAPVLDGAEPAQRGPRFLWKAWPTARLVAAEQTDDGVLIVAEVPGRVRRRVTLGPHVLAVEDEVLDPAVQRVTATWLLAPGAENRVRVDAPEVERVESRPDGTDGWYSPTYGVRVPAVALRTAARRAGGAPLRLLTRLTLARGEAT